MRRLMMAVAMLLLGAAGSGALAGTVKVTASKAAVQTACYQAGGKYTAGKGPGGYGCKTGQGEIKCDRKGNCTATCDKCGTRASAATQTLRNQPPGIVTIPAPALQLPQGPSFRSYNSAITEAYRRYGNPQRPTDCPRYVIDPDDECY